MASATNQSDIPDRVRQDGYSKVELSLSLRRVADELGHAPRQKDCTEHADAIGPRVYYHYWDSWGDALEAAGLDPDEREFEQWFTDDELLGWIHAFVEQFGIPPANSDVRNWPGPSHGTYNERFGGVAHAVEAAGYEPRGKEQL